MSGFVAIARKIFTNPMFAGDAYSKREALIYLVVRADWHGEKRGTFSCYLSELATVFGWTKSSVDRFLKKLISENVIETVSETEAERNRITYKLTNYERYQTVNSSGLSSSETEAKQIRNSQRNGPINKDLKQNTTITKPLNPPTPLPTVLDIPEFHQALADWESHKSERKDKLTPLSRKKLINKLESIGVERAIAAINFSIEKGWAGVYEEKGSFIGAPKKQSNAEFSANLRRNLEDAGL
jgi:hypothetical protein